jgi:short subunit dehydrogenase-like uncharacterized protein
MPTYLIYGANGYTGALIAREAVARGQRPILAGRDRDAVANLASELALEYRCFRLDDPVALDAGLRGMTAVLNCAGPFAHTCKPMADACLRTGMHYLDITGEVLVFESLAARDAEAKAADVMLMPGVGFDVVPSDCLAAHLKRRLPSATTLALAFYSTGRLSRGSASTVAENFPHGGLVRRDGLLTPVPAAWKMRAIDFGAGPRRAVTIPWGDLATAYRTTGIPNIEVYTVMQRRRRVAMRLSRYLGWLLGSATVQGYLQRRIRSGPPGPTDAERSRGRSYLWGEASDDQCRRVVSRLRGPDGYTLTALSAVAVVQCVLAGQSPAGFHTPAQVYGADFALTLPGVVREDLPVQNGLPVV